MFGESQANLLFLRFLLFQLFCSFIAIPIGVCSVLILGTAKQTLQLVLYRGRFGLGGIGQDCICGVQHPSAVDFDVDVNVGFLNFVLSQIGDGLVDSVDLKSGDISRSWPKTQR